MRNFGDLETFSVVFFAFYKLNVSAGASVYIASKEAKKSFRGGTWRASNPRRRRRGVRGAEDQGAEGVERVGNRDGVSPSPGD